MTKPKIDISIICCYNNKKQLDEMLLPSIKNQTVEPQLILVDNTANKFSSASAALNYGAEQASRNYYIFLHQDIKFTRDDALEKIYQKLSENTEPDTIWGAAGVADRFGRKVISWMESPGIKRNPQMDCDIIPVDCLDECLIILSRELFSKYKFNETVCDNWHFYVVELCIRAKLDGIRIAVFDMSCFHYSGGSRNHLFYKTLKKLKKEYKHKIDHINTCCIEYSDFKTPVWRLELGEKYRNWRDKK
ncbi:MAG: glycosyltransferase [Ruminococcus sp.]